jgi:hypothetical protein
MSQPFTLRVPDAELQDFRDRIARAPLSRSRARRSPSLTERASTAFAALGARSGAGGPHNCWFVGVCRWFTRKDGNGEDF